MAFNMAVTTKSGYRQMEADRQLIESLGGPARVARMLGYEKHGGVQRVQNWMTRGIPARVKLQHPAIFLRDHQATPTRQAA